MSLSVLSLMRETAPLTGSTDDNDNGGIDTTDRTLTGGDDDWTRKQSEAVLKQSVNFALILFNAVICESLFLIANCGVYLTVDENKRVATTCLDLSSYVLFRAVFAGCVVVLCTVSSCLFFFHTRQSPAVAVDDPDRLLPSGVALFQVSFTSATLIASVTMIFFSSIAIVAYRVDGTACRHISWTLVYMAVGDIVLSFLVYGPVLVWSLYWIVGAVLCNMTPDDEAGPW